MGNDWIKPFKDRIGFSTVAEALGMSTHGGRARWRPCKACGQDRTGSDQRAPVTVGADMAWKCHACGAKGDVVTLLCYAVASTDSPSNEGWEQVRQFAVKQGWIKDEGGHVSGRVRPMGSALKPTVQSKPAAPPTSPEETPAEQSVNTRGLFRWSEDLPERCALVYVNPGAACRDWSDAHKQIAVEVVRYLTEYRKISDDVLIDAKIGIYVDESGQPILSEGRPWITIPLPDKAGRFVNVHFRRVPIPGTCAACDALGFWKECDPCRKGKRYRLCPGRPTPLYGADRLTPGKGAVARVIEGELDVLALRTYGMGENTVSGTSGASNFAEDWLDSLEPFDSIYLCYDDDEAGKKGASDLAAKLGTYKCSKVTFPKKDAGDCLIAGVPAETMARAFKVADSYLDVKLRKADEFRERVKDRLQNTEQRRGVSTTSEVMDSAIGGWSNGLVILTGETGMGKTTWATWQLWALAKSGQCVAVTSFEQQPEETVIQLLHMELGGMPDEFKEADWDAALDRLAELPILIVDHYGHLPYPKLEEALKYAVRRCGARYILIDHLGFLVDPEAEDERRAIQSVVRSMVLVRKDMDVTIFLIVHPRNDPDASKKFGRVTMQHLKGASAIRQDADMVLIVTRELPNTEKGRLLPKGKRRPWPQTRIYIDKKRGRYGNVSGAGEVVMAFDPKALVFADTWDQTPMGRAGVLIDTSPSEVKEEGDDIENSTPGKGGTKKTGRGKKTKTAESAFDENF